MSLGDKRDLLVARREHRAEPRPDARSDLASTSAVRDRAGRWSPLRSSLDVVGDAFIRTDREQVERGEAAYAASMAGLDGFDDGTLDRIDRIVERAVEQGQAPGVVAAVACGETVHVATAGVVAVGGAPMRRDTLVRISSTTKPMTAAAVLSLVDEGLLDLDAPIDELLPSSPAAVSCAAPTGRWRTPSRRIDRSRRATY